MKNTILVPASVTYPKDIKPLTSLRFFAAISIVIFHYTHEIDVSHESIPGRLYTGVDFFFILSGFILAHCYIKDIENGKFSARDFYIKRFARIYPVHTLTLIAAGLVTVIYILLLQTVFYPNETKICFFSSLLMVHAWGIHSDTCFNNPSWSISAEWFAYLLFPLLAAKAMNMKPSSVVLYSGLSLLAFCVLFHFLGKPFTQLTAQGFLRILPTFFMGIGLYLLGRQYSLRHAGKTWIYASVTSLIFSVSVGLPDFVTVMLFAVLIFVIADNYRKGTPTILENKHLIYWGEVSFSIYMWHYVFHKAITTPVMMRALDGSKAFGTPYWIAALISLILTFIVSHLTYKYVERPSRAWITDSFIRKKGSKN